MNPAETQIFDRAKTKKKNSLATADDAIGLRPL